jgi:hypothetical protein
MRLLCRTLCAHKRPMTRALVHLCTLALVHLCSSCAATCASTCAHGIGNRVAVSSRDLAKLDAIIDYAKRLKDWPLLKQAIDDMLEKQREFVDWWRDNLSAHHGRPEKCAPLRTLTLEQAENLTGITHQQVSKCGSSPWRP